MMVPVAEAAWRDVRPKGWHSFHAALDVEDVGHGWVKMLWRVDRGDDPPGPVTMFRVFEWVEVW